MHMNLMVLLGSETKCNDKGTVDSFKIKQETRGIQMTTEA